MGKGTKKMTIPSARPYFGDIDDILIDVGRALESGRLILGEYTAKFERSFAEYINVKHAVAVSSATAALEIVLRYYDVKGYEVILPTNTFIACPNSVGYAGGKPVFADIDPHTFCIDPASILKQVSSKTKGIMVVHLAGLPVPQLEEIKETCQRYGLFLLEDASHAHGATIRGTKVGAIGDAGCFSFYATKNITTGVGGMITTNDENLAKFARSLRHHGQGESLDQIVNFGNDWLMDELSAILGIYQVARLEENVSQRNEIAKKYMLGIDRLDDIAYLSVPPNVRHAYYKFLAVLDLEIDKQKLIAAMREKHSIEIGTLYMTPCHLHLIYRQLGYKEGMLPVAEEALKHQISLPTFVSITDEEIDTVLRCLKEEIPAAKRMTGKH